MKCIVERAIAMAAIIVILVGRVAFAQTQPALTPIQVLILGGNPDYNVALKTAKQLAKRGGVAFERLGTVYNSKTRTLEMPPRKGEPDFPYLGRAPGPCEKYTECISVEQSSAYPGMKEGLFIIVGGVFLDREDDARSKELLTFFKKLIPDAYLKKTTWDGSCPL